MALNRLDFGTVPNPVTGDWAKLSAIVAKAFQNTYDPLQFVSTNVLQGATFQIGGIIYYGNSDTAITGTPSNYVKLTPNAGDSGATCDAAFVADLTGVTWNKIYNGYYDVSGNLYIFDEIAAILATDLVGSNTKFSEMFNTYMGQSLKSTDSPTFVDITADSIDSVQVVTAALDWSNVGDTEDDVYQALAPYLPDSKNILCSGIYGSDIITRIRRNGTVGLTLYYGINDTSRNILNGDATAMGVSGMIAF